MRRGVSRAGLVVSHSAGEGGYAGDASPGGSR